MEIYEITGFETGISRAGVNYLQPADSFQNIQNGFIHRQVLQSRKGFQQWSFGYDDGLGGGPSGHLPTRVMGIFQNVLTATSTYETLAFDLNFLYKYNNSLNTFVRIPFGGSLTGFAGFALSSNDYYISGTTYPDKNGVNRFVFTSKGMPTGTTGVFFYDGTNVLDFTDNTPVTGDNPDYQAYATGDINKATYVFWFGERLNFVAPTINTEYYPQGMLYSAIRNSAGNGDKFNSSGAGLLQIDTYEHIQGAAIFGDKIALNADKSNWTIEKTKDAFNPYFSRKIPSVLGTDASFSPVAWNYELRSLGRTGIIATDGRQSQRVDSKIPYFTTDDIDPIQFQLTYGGFDRTNSQFLWSYLSSVATEDTQDKVLSNSYEEKSWAVFDMRFSVFGESADGQNLVWDDIFEDNNPAWVSWDTTEEVWDKIGLGASVLKTLAGDDLGFIYELSRDYDDYQFAITGISQAAQAVITMADHPFLVGDRVSFEGVAGMTQINGLEAIILSITTTTATVNIDSTLFSSYSSGGLISKPINFYAETVPFNPYRAAGMQCRISHIEFLLDNNGATLSLDIFMDGNSTPFKKDVLLATSRGLKSREWLTVAINNTADFMTLKMKQESASNQIRITSIRIHCQPGGYSNG